MTTNQPLRTMPLTASELLVWYRRLITLLNYVGHLFVQGYNAVLALVTPNPAAPIQSAQDKASDTAAEFSTKKQFAAKSTPDDAINPWLQEATEYDVWTQEVAEPNEVQQPDPCRLEFSGPLDHNHYKPGT